MGGAYLDLHSRDVLPGDVPPPQVVAYDIGKAGRLEICDLVGGEDMVVLSGRDVIVALPRLRMEEQRKHIGPAERLQHTVQGRGGHFHPFVFEVLLYVF